MAFAISNLQLLGNLRIAKITETKVNSATSTDKDAALSPKAIPSTKKTSSIKITGQPKATIKAVSDSQAKQKLTVVKKTIARSKITPTISKVNMGQVKTEPVKPTKKIPDQQDQLIRRYQVEKGSVKRIAPQGKGAPVAQIDMKAVRTWKIMSPGTR